MTDVDFVAHLNNEDDNGLKWGLLRDARDPTAVSAGSDPQGGKGQDLVLGAGRGRRSRRTGPLRADRWRGPAARRGRLGTLTAGPLESAIGEMIRGDSAIVLSVLAHEKKVTDAR